MDPSIPPRGAPDLAALITACIAGVDQLKAIRELNTRLAEIAGADEAAAPLLRAVGNLLDGVLAGSVSGVEQAMELVAESAVGLQAGRDGNRAESLPGHRLDLIERLDLMASGVTDVDLKSFAPSSMQGAAEPPLLTEREDGSRVELGRFDEQTSLPGKTTGDEPRTVGAIMDAMDSVLLRLARQVETVRSRTDAGQDRDLQRALAELSKTVRELEDLKAALARGSKESTALLRGRPGL